MKKSLILIGGGGHCGSCIDVIETEGKYVIEGILDRPDKLGTHVLRYPIVGDDDLIDTFIKRGFYFLITFGHIRPSQKRKSLYLQLKAKGAKLATIVAPTATVSKYATIEEGTIVMHQAVINAGASVGNNVILNTNCLVEHDVVIGDHVHISTHAVLNGGVVIDENSFIGSNAVVVQGVIITREVTVGAGSVVIKNINEAGIFAGNPAKAILK
jgi:sugar O-acyltransferase (sialic acid O-acetyltransferase NeuD family)